MRNVKLCFGFYASKHSDIYSVYKREGKKLTEDWPSGKNTVWRRIHASSGKGDDQTKVNSMHSNLACTNVFYYSIW